MNKHSIKLIDKFLNKELNETEMADFQKKISHNKKLASDVAFMKEIDQAIAEKNIIKLRHQLQLVHDELSTAKKGKTIPMFSYNKRLVVGIAASIVIVLCIGAYLIINSSKTWDQQSLYSYYYQPEEAVMMSRSGSNDADNLLKDALLAFHEKDYETAIKLFSQKSDNFLAKFYLGVSYLETGKTNQSIVLFQEIIKHQDNLFVEQAEWYLGLCYLKTNQMDKAKNTFKTISEGKSIYASKARDILKKI